MVMMIGDFAGGECQPTCRQLAATLGAIAAVQRRAGLAAAALRLHEELTGAPCPGLARQPLIEGLTAVALPAAGARTTGFPDWATRNHELLSGLGAVVGPPEEMSGAEPPHGPGAADSRSGGRAGEDISAFADHWINLDRGAFSTEGRLGTTQTDVDRIFLERLPAEIARAKAQDRPLNVLFYAHGGLVSEDVGIAHMTADHGLAGQRRLSDLLHLGDWLLVVDPRPAGRRSRGAGGRAAPAGGRPGAGGGGAPLWRAVDLGT